MDKEETLSTGFKIGNIGVARALYAREEYSEAIKTLAHYHFAKCNANIYHSYRSTCWRLIDAEPAKPYVGRSRRCGLPISNPVSLGTEHGEVCIRKLGIKLSKEKESRSL